MSNELEMGTTSRRRRKISGKTVLSLSLILVVAAVGTGIGWLVSVGMILVFGGGSF